MYCFARKIHSYLDLDTGLGFDSQIVDGAGRLRVPMGHVSQ
ncbi:hypothetical protein SCANM124S_00142 [Streptomyces canus]|nr:hypothetical protein [Streptomyces canus]